MATGDKLHIPLGKWLAPTHRIWIWYYSPTSNDLYQIKEEKVQHYLPASNHQQTRSATTYTFVWEEDITPDFKTGMQTSVVSFSNNNANKLNKGDTLAKGTSLPTDFWDFLETWGGMWMWEGINETSQLSVTSHG